MKKLRVAIIGQGRSGRNIHALHIQSLPRMFQIVAAVDPIKIRRDRAAAEFGCDVYKDHKPLLKRTDLDFVVNASTSDLHVPITLDLFKAGHNVLTEKPLARKVADVDKLIAAAKKSKVMFAIYQQSRFAPYFLQVQKVLASGVLGRVTQISINYNGFSRRWDWQTLTSMGAGNLTNTGPHPLDQALRFLDYPTNKVPEVFCYMDRTHFFGDAEGHVNLSLRAPGRPLVDVNICSDCAYPSFNYNVCATQGGLAGSFSELKWKYFDPKKAPKHTAKKAPISTPEGMPTYCPAEKLPWVEKKWTVPKAQADLFDTIGTRYYKNLHAHLTQGTPLEVKVDEVRQQVAVIEEAHRQNPHIWAKTQRAKKAKKATKK